MAKDNQKPNHKLWPTIGVILALVFIYFIMMPSSDYTISVIDKNKTDKIEINIKNLTDGAGWKEKTDSKGQWTKTFKFEKNDKINILFNKQGYKIEPPSVSYTAHQLRNEVIRIEATKQGHDVTFKVKNGLDGVKILQRSIANNSQTLLGRTNSGGELTARIISKQGELFTFDYEYDGGQTHSDIPTTITISELPKLINLRVIPAQPIVVNLRSVKTTNLNRAVSGVRLLGKNSENFDISIISNNEGLAEGIITSDPETGPFIGDKIVWSASKSGYKASPKQSIRITQNKFKYPSDTGSLQFNVAKEYRLTIRVEEENRPLKNIDIFINNMKKGKTNSAGQLEYVYTDEELGQRINISINTLGISAIKKNKRLSRSNEIITLGVVSIHAILDLRDESTGDPILGKADVILNNKTISTLDNFGLYKIMFPKYGDYALTIRTDQYYEKKWKLKLTENTNGFPFVVQLTKQPFIDCHVAYGGGIPVKDVIVKPSIGIGGKTDKNGNFIYKVVDPVKSIKFQFSKAKHTIVTKTLSPDGDLTNLKVNLPKLSAYFYVYNRKTSAPEGNLEVRVNNELQTTTNASGKAIINPEKINSNLNLSISASDGSFIVFKKKITFKQSQNLGTFYIDPRPIKINVKVEWAPSFIPLASGKLELNQPYMLHNLSPNDGGKHTFNIYDRTASPTLTIAAINPGNGSPITNEVKINIPADPKKYTVDIPIRLSIQPSIDVQVCDGVSLDILQKQGSNTIRIVSGHYGSWQGQLVEYGTIEIILSSEPADTQFVTINQPEQVIKLCSGESCSQANNDYNNGNWDALFKSAAAISPAEDCYCKMNEETGKVAMNERKDFANAIQFFNKVAYESTNCSDQWKSPYMHLRRMQCYLELIGNTADAYSNAQDAQSSFNSVVQLLDPKSKQETMCQYRYLRGQLMFKQYYSLCDQKTSTSSPTTIKKITQEMKTIRAAAIMYIEEYENLIGNCPSMSNELYSIREGC